ncbi:MULTISPECIES: MerR family transcriptional regulator [unclassified Streptomyces]|uniref:MerR family transcriptional regulator n=1 Tax=unclassified Streptomyces TaxID=2593676 RepID=UPI002E2D108A|nr:MerR family transcriptional regulator [Streptomyces sp. NBC_00223]
MSDDALSIGELAGRLGLPISTLHYWERRGLITPERRSGVRYFDSEQQYRVAVIKVWSSTGRMTLEDIAAVMAGRSATYDWRDTVTDRIEAIDAHMEELLVARNYLSYVLECTRDNPYADCTVFRAEITVPSGRAHHPHDDPPGRSVRPDRPVRPRSRR